jgi:GNAT superfamily N-acetyltransferase
MQKLSVTAQTTHIRETFTVTSDPSKLDLAVIAQFLASSYWAKGIPVATVEKSLQNSLCFALLDGERQIGFGRVISDRATFAFLADVFVVPEYQGRGLGKWLVECILGHPDLQGLRRWILGTLDAHGLYERFGFTPLARPEAVMERRTPNGYEAGV